MNTVPADISYYAYSILYDKPITIMSSKATHAPLPVLSPSS